MKKRKNLNYNSEIVKEVLSIIGNEPTLREMEEKTGISSSTIFRIRNDQAVCTVSDLERLMKAYKITWHLLLWRLTNPNRTA